MQRAVELPFILGASDGVQVGIALTAAVHNSTANIFSTAIQGERVKNRIVVRVVRDTRIIN